MNNLPRELRLLAAAQRELSTTLFEIVEELEQKPPTAPPWIDRVAEMPLNYQPHAPYCKNHNWNFWPSRTTPPTGLTIHHTLSHSPLATARYCTGPKGCPSIQYHWWVSQDDGCPIFLLADPSWQLLHDCTGLYPETLSIGMAGKLHLSPPPDEQIEAVARLCAYLLAEYELQAEGVQGHCDRWGLNRWGKWKTQCPGWYNDEGQEQSGFWRKDFQDALLEAMRVE